MGRRLVIPDIHGCSLTFKKLVEKIAFTRDDTMYLLGDYIDRGPDSSGVIDYILKLQSNLYRVIPIRGNHEENFIKAFREFDAETFHFYVKRNNSKDLLTTDGKIPDSYLHFFLNLPYHIELPDYILVHAGINFGIEAPFSDTVSLLELRNTHYHAEKAANRRIVFGHQPYYLSDIEKAISNREMLIALDNGCVYTKPHRLYDYTRLGTLLCFDLDSFKLWKQECVD